MFSRQTAVHTKTKFRHVLQAWVLGLNSLLTVGCNTSDKFSWYRWLLADTIWHRKTISIPERVTVYRLFTNVNKMQSIEIEFKYAHHTSTTITRENRLKKINRKKKIPLVSGSLFVQASVSYSKLQNCAGAWRRWTQCTVTWDCLKITARQETNESLETRWWWTTDCMCISNMIDPVLKSLYTDCHNKI